MTSAGRVAVIGAGWAGLAAAVELTAAGRQVDVFEASRTLGGRARRVDTHGMAVDNGQHILIGAYAQTLRLMRTVGADPDRLLQRRPLHLEIAGEFRLAAPRLPAPLHTAFALLGARGLDWREKLAAIALMRRLQAGGFRVAPDCTVADWLQRQEVPSRQRRLLWEPLCIAALNTAAERASAQVMANVLRDSLAGPRAASDLLLPAADLGAVFPDPAAAFIAGHGGTVRTGIRIGGLQREGGRWQIGGSGYAQAVLAVAPCHVAALVPELGDAVAHFDWEPIVTVYLAYPPAAGLPQPMLGLVDGLAQWVFDRGALCGQHGLIAAVISARGRHQQLPAEALERAIHEELRPLLSGLAPLQEPLRAWTIAEKRATFACVPGLARPPTATALPGLHLAGDYVAGDYPATLEGAVRSGIAAARSVLEAPGGQP